MNIKGITIQNQGSFSICYIEQFSSELQRVIRRQLSGLYNGFADTEETPEIYSYENTIASFLDVYQSKSEATRKGMIGELLAHVVINHYFLHLYPISVLKNKEERSIKKGFDIIYFEDATTKLWYAESKSGAKGAAKDSSNANIVLLNRANSSLEKVFTSTRSYLWNSALVDVNLTVSNKSKKIDIKKLLSKDIPSKTNPPGKKNVILISVLYNELKDKINPASVASFIAEKSKGTTYGTITVLCVQKNTFAKVAQFLQSESLTASA